MWIYTYIFYRDTHSKSRKNVSIIKLLKIFSNIGKFYFLFGSICSVSKISQQIDV